MIALAVAALSDASAYTAERRRFLDAIATADVARCEDILTYSDVALVGLDKTSVFFGGEEFLMECMVQASSRLANLGAYCSPLVRHTEAA